MALFVLNSDITIGNFRFSGVHDITIKRSIHTISDTAIIRLPAVAKITRKGSADAAIVTTGKQFSEGDPVNISLGYNGVLINEFKGFVKRCSLSTPLEVECEGYGWLLKRNSVTGFYKSIGLKELLSAAIAGIDPEYKIRVRCDVDYQFSNIDFGVSNGYHLLSNIAKYSDGCLSCFFIEPDVLWCGLVYSPYATGTDVFHDGSVNYRIGYNTLKENTLKERLPENDPVQVRYSKKQSNGNTLSQASDVFKSSLRVHNKILNQIGDQKTLKTFANEKAYRFNYSGYEGSLKSFLQPYCAPGYTALINDDRYPERNGVYIIESVETQFGVLGARRVVEIGPRVGFATD